MPMVRVRTVLVFVLDRIVLMDVAVVGRDGDAQGVDVAVMSVVVPVNVFMNEGLVRVAMPVPPEKKQGHPGDHARCREEEGQNRNLAEHHERDEDAGKRGCAEQPPRPRGTHVPKRAHKEGQARAVAHGAQE